VEFSAVSAFGIELNVDAEKVSGTAESGMFGRDPRQLFIEIGEIAQLQSSGVLIALDEMHALGENDLGTLYSALHQTTQRDLPVALLGAGLFPFWQSGADRVDPTPVRFQRWIPFTPTVSRIRGTAQGNNSHRRAPPIGTTTNLTPRPGQQRPRAWNEPPLNLVPSPSMGGGPKLARGAWRAGQLA
jgi:hypothetical protein